MSEDKSEVLGDWLADTIEEDDSESFKVEEQFEANWSTYDECWGSKLIIRHNDGSLYEVTINPLNDWYDSEFGDDKECECGHTYHRHFDSYSVTMEPVGCKYCQCHTFQESKQD